MKYFVYVLSNKNRTLFKVNVTENLNEMLKVEQTVHREVYIKSSGINELIHSEEYPSLEAAVKRCDEIKRNTHRMFGKRKISN